MTMITHHKNRRGRPKSTKEPETTASRVSKFRKNQKANGGVTTTINFDEQEIEQIERIKRQIYLSEKTSRSEVIKAMTCLLSGGTYFINGLAITATIISSQRND